MGDVEHAGRRALGELRHLLGVLRPDVSEYDDLGPQPGLADIAALADELTRTGADVTVAVGPYPAALSAALQLSAFRIVQESVTNILKHAGPNPTVRLAVGADDEMLAIDITNTTARPIHGLPGSGFGIAGMCERAALLGGTLTAEPRPPDHFHVSARLPLEAGRA
jgi:signal transduction histidine kinase